MKHAVSFFIGGLGLLVVLFILGMGLPWYRVTWGRIIFDQPRTITVMGSAERQETNQLASFSAGVEAANLDKQAALTTVQLQMEKIITELQAVGVPEADIKTQNVSVWQSQDPVPMANGRTSTKPGEWRVNNTIDVTVRNAIMADTVQELLNNSGATNVYGPNYRTDDSQTGDDLLAQAVENARKKAEAIAAAQKMEVVKVVSITEGGSASDVIAFSAMKDGRGGGGPILPGTSTVGASAVVVFEVR